jgi:Arc/MetJ-type ribon-helix-helix transcriptional regulator
MLESFGDRMSTTLVNIRMPLPLMEELKEAVQDEGFASVQEYIKHTVREDLRLRSAARRKRVSDALHELDRLAGSAKGITPKTKAEVEAHIKRAFGYR